MSKPVPAFPARYDDAGKLIVSKTQKQEPITWERVYADAWKAGRFDVVVDLIEGRFRLMDRG